MLFESREITEGLIQIRDVVGTFFYLAVGEEKALLVDTGCGIGDVYSFVKGLTDKPIEVVLTHGHVDHALGTKQFETVYISPKEKEVYAAHAHIETQKGYFASIRMMGIDPEKTGVTDADFQPLDPFEKFLPLKDGDIFELGGLSAEIVELSGHTPGCMCVLFPKLRILLLGDAANAFTYLFDPWCPTVAEYEETLIRVKEKLDGKYDRALFCHGASGEDDPAMLSGVIQVCEDIKAGNVDNFPFRGPTGEAAAIAKAMNFERFVRVDGGCGNIVYRPEAQ